VLTGEHAAKLSTNPGYRRLDAIDKTVVAVTEVYNRLQHQRNDVATVLDLFGTRKTSCSTSPSACRRVVCDDAIVTVQAMRKTRPTTMSLHP
jgi:hypothetical protein